MPCISALYECCLSVPISDAFQCPSVPPTSASSSVPISATYQCCQSVPVSATYQGQSVPPISAANQCHISVPCISAL
ncbi:unnamed protein product, partial [Staurois parvus]